MAPGVTPYSNLKLAIDDCLQNPGCTILHLLAPGRVARTQFNHQLQALLPTDVTVTLTANRTVKFPNGSKLIVRTPHAGTTGKSLQGLNVDKTYINPGANLKDELLTVLRELRRNRPK